ncbi:MAG: D,D-heptose 1,7-bisphosphate phosphatase [Hirschia sp.]|nr:D,D-heptose 1,7-bisphosphate phosphatase [Hirschia sp.]MBF17351.1 D,D-heptose 1,7-bisphosphate phosphatase [Hirschia sp.]
MTLAPSPPKDQLLPALFLDRDGVINVDHGYVSEIEKFELVPGIVDAIRRFNERNWRVIVATNQSGIARAFYTEKDMFTLHAHMESELADAGARIDAIYHCPFHEEGEIEEYRRDSELRKPRPGMLLQAMKDFPTEKRLSFMVGDKLSDVQAAESAGIHGFLYKEGDIDAFIEGAYHTMMALKRR